MSIDFAELANLKTEDVKKPPLPPQGNYRWQITKLPSDRKSKDEKWLFVNFPCRAVEALDAGMMDGYEGEVTGIVMVKSFMVDREDAVAKERGLYRIRMFLEEHVGATGSTMGELFNSSVNGQFIAPIVYREREDTKEMQAEIGNTAPVA